MDAAGVTVELAVALATYELLRLGLGPVEVEVANVAVPETVELKDSLTAGMVDALADSWSTRALALVVLPS